MPELVDRPDLPENPSPVCIGEEVHQRPWQSLAECQPPSGYRVGRPRRSAHAHPAPAHEPCPDREHEPAYGSGRQPEHEPEREPERQPEREHKEKRPPAITGKHRPGTRYSREIAWRAGEPGRERAREPEYEAGHEPVHRPSKEPEREPEREPGPNQGHEPEHEPSREPERQPEGTTWHGLPQLPPGQVWAADVAFEVAGQEY